ncbi:nucleotidyltransferase family protein [Bifidobacterium simiarum]|uniref:nucleotidyltransferase domain-containing protein n=1 Tax=Bifidobacterium simiarum TaxID=2045441 RepID=UPI001BDBCECB|nr:nucleotidyltransferase family protein [Bifidobacterium simiarum]MBT1166435.1 nucleotidyltransferase family protein [Bifidobacterium simiarum]
MTQHDISSRTEEMPPAQLRRLGDQLVELIAAALREDRSDEDGDQRNTDPSDINSQDINSKDWVSLYELAAFHSVEALTWTGMSGTMRNQLPEDLAAKWRNDADLTLFRQLAYDADRESILADFRNAGLSWLPLKGIVTATYYPQPGLRSMGDQDLVFGFTQYDDALGAWRFRGNDADERQAKEIEASGLAKSIMEAHGYRKRTEWERELSYIRDGLHFELHRCIVTDTERSQGYYDDAMNRYYANPWQLAIPDDEGSGNSEDGHAGGFHFRPDDEYVFHIAHMMKHYRSSGFGLRFLADEAVFCRRFGGTGDGNTGERFDWDYIHAELRKLELDQFETMVRSLSLALFDHPHDWRRHVGPSERQLFAEIIESGVYGTKRNGATKSFDRQRQAAQREGRRTRVGLIYGWRRIYPPRSWVEQHFPEWAGTWWKRALLPLYRVARGLRRHPKDLLFELKLMLRK